MAPWVRHPRHEAQALLPDEYAARVLEPSPPAVTIGEYRADDPAAVGVVPPGKLVVSPTTAGDVTWDQIARRNPGLSEFCAQRWLGAWPRLVELPAGYAAIVLDLNQVAFHALAPTRYEACGKVGLRYTLGGFGTPFFGHDRQVRIEGTQLVIQEPAGARGQNLTTLRQAAVFLGVEYRVEWGPVWRDPPAPIDPDRQLNVTAEAVAAMSGVIGFAFSILEQLRTEATPDEAPSRVQLWPEHFDVAIEIGSESRGSRAAFGMSPGYAAHPQPFVYVSPWVKTGLTAAYWNADFFGGSILRYSDLLAAEDQRPAALAFLRTGLELLREH